MRFGLGNAYLGAGDAQLAVRTSAARDRNRSRLLRGVEIARQGADGGGPVETDALAAYRDGIAAAERKGDKQALKEMQVFARRLAKQA